jgi:hypothetical protein
MAHCLTAYRTSLKHVAPVVTYPSVSLDTGKARVRVHVGISGSTSQLFVAQIEKS